MTPPISDRMGANSKPKSTPRLPTKPKKVSGPKTNPKKSHAELPSKFVCIYSQTRFASMIYYRDYYHESSDCFEYPKKSLLQIRPPKKNTCQILLPPKKFRNRNFQIHKILPSSPSLEIRSTPPPPRICLYKA